MKILIVTNTYPPADISGVGALVYELARRLDGSGHFVRVLTREAPAEDSWAIGTGGRKLLFPLAVAWRAVQLQRRHDFDLVHVHESDGVLVCGALQLARWLRPRRRSPRLVATLQVSYRQERLAVRPVCDGERVVSRPTRSERVFGWVRAPILSWLGRLTAGWSDAVVAPSRVTADELVADYGTQVEAVIPNGVAATVSEAIEATEPPESAEASTEVPDGRGDGPLVLYAGRLRTRKAVAVLIEAFAQVVERRSDARLVLAGDGEHRATLEARVAELGLGESIRFLGAVPRAALDRWYEEADVFCLPSIYEGFPLAILEAMAAGLPVVSTLVSGIPEAVEHRRSGLLVQAESADELARALLELLDDPERRRALGEAARLRVAEHFGIDRVAELYLDLWNRLLEGDGER